SLSTQQQAIIDAIAQNWDAISTKEISKKIRMASKSVSSQLNQLEKNQLIIKIPTSIKNQLYQISERFFNIYYLMRLGKRKNKRKVLWLVKFFEIMCAEKEFIARAQRHIKGIREGQVYDKHAFYVSQALARTHIPAELQHELIIETKKYLSARRSEFIKEIDKSHFEILDEVKNDIVKCRYDSAKKKLKDDGMAVEEIPFVIAEFLRTEKGDYKTAVNFYEKAIEKGHSGAMFNLALMYEKEYKDFKNAEKYYLLAIEKSHVHAMYHLAWMYKNEYKDFKNAEKYYLMAVEKGDSGAMNNLALMYQTEYKDFKNAEKYYLLAIEKGHSGAMYNFALMYQTEYKDFKNAEKYYLMAIEKGDSGAMNNLALMYQTEYKDFKNAEKYYLMAIEKDHSGAMNNLALMYQTEYKDFKNAEKYYLMAVEKDHSGAMYNLALMYKNEYKDFKNAEKYYLMAIEKGDSGAMNNLALMYETEFEDFKNAEKYYFMAIEKGDSGAMNNLAWMYYQFKTNKIKALELQRKIYEMIKVNITAYGYIMILLWNDIIEDAINVYKEFFDNEESQKEVNDLIYSILLLLLAKKQYNFVLRLFTENKFDIKDKYKPIYYAVIKLLGEEFADEFRKIPPELKETVDEIIKQVEQMSKDYS
ncbi:MAG: sel1 repeat family protein, partial [Bacteroidetes bacterium]|nr:sel1 repeat family protein [Bacteroidota bacterium]